MNKPFTQTCHTIAEHFRVCLWGPNCWSLKGTINITVFAPQVCDSLANSTKISAKIEIFEKSALLINLMRGRSLGLWPVSLTQSPWRELSPRCTSVPATFPMDEPTTPNAEARPQRDAKTPRHSGAQQLSPNCQSDRSPAPWGRS